MKQITTEAAKEYLENECYKGDLEHFIGQEGILIDEHNIVKIMKDFAQSMVDKAIKEYKDNVGSGNDFYNEIRYKCIANGCNNERMKYELYCNEHK